MRHNNPALTMNALAAALAVIDSELDGVREQMSCTDAYMCDHIAEELAELRVTKRVLERLYHEAHMDALEAAEYEEMYRDREEEEREERSYRKDFEELDELLGGLTDRTEEEREELRAIAADLRELMESDLLG